MRNAQLRTLHLYGVELASTAGSIVRLRRVAGEPHDFMYRERIEDASRQKRSTEESKHNSAEGRVTRKQARTTAKMESDSNGHMPPSQGVANGKTGNGRTGAAGKTGHTEMW